MILERETTPAERAFLLAHDSDPFNKWEAGPRHRAGDPRRPRRAIPAAAVDPEYLAALAAVADDPRLDPAFKALALGLPSEDEIIAHIAAAGRAPGSAGGLARAAQPRGGGRPGARRPAAGGSMPSNAVPGPYSPDAAAAGHRALRGRALGLATALDPEARRRGRSSPPPTT